MINQYSEDEDEEAEGGHLTMDDVLFQVCTKRDLLCRMH